MNSILPLAQFGSGLMLLLLLIFSVLQWLHIPAGHFLDWVIGGGIFWWLMLIVTLPWNIHFDAKEVLAEAEESKKKAIKIDQNNLNYVNKLARYSLWVAIALHLISAIGLYSLAAIGISVIGYFGSGAALLLTILRPAIRTYQYIVTRLSMVKREFKYPREDILELRNRFKTVEENMNQLIDKLNPDHPNSWVAKQQKQQNAIHHDVNRLASELEQLKVLNQAEHQQLGKVTETAIAKLNADAEFLNHAREIIRFFKEA